MNFKQNITLMLFLSTIISIACRIGNETPSNKNEIFTNEQALKSEIFDKVLEGSAIHWKATHLGGVDPRIGKIYCSKASIIVKEGKLAKADILIDMNNLSVDNIPEDGAKSLVEHLKSSDFFDVDKYPNSSFELSRIMNIEGEYNSKVSGNLIILGVRKGINFNANISISENEIIIKSERFEIDRSRWGMTYNAKGTFGVPLDYLISDDIDLEIDVTISK